MPDIVRDGSNSVMLWLDEICSSCQATESCVLIAAVKDLNLTTYGGIHVMSCSNYIGDGSETESEDVGMRTQVQKLEKLVKELNLLLGTDSPNGGMHA